MYSIKIATEKLDTIIPSNATSGFNLWKMIGNYMFAL